MQQHSSDMRRVFNLAESLIKKSVTFDTQDILKNASLPCVEWTRVYFIVLTKPLILISFISFVHCNSFLTERRICPQKESWKFSHAGEEEHFLPGPKYIDRNHKWLWMTSKTVLWEGKKMQNRSLIVMDDLGASRLNTPLENEIKALCPDRRRDKLKIHIFAFATTSATMGRK